MWVNKDKNGKHYFSFKAERDIKSGESFNIFKNNKGDNQDRPDYKSYEKIEDEMQAPPKKARPEIITKDVDESDIPF